MPNLGAGVPNNVALTTVPLQVFTPTPSVSASCRFVNLGNSTIYIGGANVSPTNGFPIPPGNRPVELQNVNTNLYACCGYGATATGPGTLTSAVAAGSTTIAISGTVPLGSFIRIGNAAGYEFLQQTGNATTGTVTVATATLYDHAAAATVLTTTVIPSPLSVIAGVV